MLLLGIWLLLLLLALAVCCLCALHLFFAHFLFALKAVAVASCQTVIEVLVMVETMSVFFTRGDSNSDEGAVLI